MQCFQALHFEFRLAISRIHLTMCSLAIKRSNYFMIACMLQLSHQVKLISKIDKSLLVSQKLFRRQIHQNASNVCIFIYGIFIDSIRATKIFFSTYFMPNTASTFDLISKISFSFGFAFKTEK